ncbi:MAG TPA: ATP-binding protein [Chroococcales cyanobacterium]
MKENQKSFLSVQIKLVFILSAFLFLSLATFGSTLNALNTHTLQDQTRRREELFARNVQQSIDQVLFAGKYQAQAYVESLVKREKSLLYVTIIDRDTRRAIAHSDPHKVGLLYDDPVTRRAFASLHGDRTVLQTIRSPSGESIDDLTLPFERGYLREAAGIIRIGISASAEEEAIRSSRLVTFALTLFLLGVGLILAIALTLRLTSALNGLVSAARLLGEGKYETRVPLSPNKFDELDLLAIAFNQMAEKLHGYAEHLERQVSERSKELASLNQALKESEERTRAQYDKLKELDRMKDDFLSVISHELRTPLNAIMGFGSILGDEVTGPLNAEQQECADKILSGSEKMLVLVNDLLDFACMQAGRFRIVPALTDYAELVQEAVASFKLLAKEKEILLEARTEVPENLFLDGHRIYQVIANLIVNSIKFTPKGGKIILSSRIEGDDLLTEVRDTGMGISPEDLPKLFAPFVQLDMSVTRKVGGVGLGLSISKAIVEAHAGTIWADSPGPGKGATIRFLLPIREKK